MSYGYARTTYSGSAPGADSNTYVMFSSVTAFPGGNGMQSAGVKRLRIDLKHSQTLTLNTYKSSDRGVTWNQVSTESIATTASTTDAREFNVEPYADFKVEVVNGGVAQATFAVDIALSTDD
jgi:hypothetical protein